MRSYHVSSPAERGGAAVARRAAAAAAARAGQHGVRAIRCDAVAGSPGECVAHAVASPRAAQRAAVALQSAHDEAVARIALSVLSDVARHSLLHATAVADAGGITAAASLLGSPDVKTRRQVCVCLSTIARHSESLALQVLDQHGASRLLLCLHDSSPSLQVSAAAAVREVARQGPAAAGRLVGMGSIGPLLDALAAWRDEGEGEGMTKGFAKVSVVVALSFLAASSRDTVLAVAASDGISLLQDLIVLGDVMLTPPSKGPARGHSHKWLPM
ncbi:unnamed protein product, partial [Closterium sp. NIES-54]